MKFLDKSKWHASHTSLSKYLVTRLYQLVDTSEVISYRYSVTNGLILIEELYDIATLCLQRFKSQERLKCLLSECVDEDIKSSVKNDVIIKTYFPQVIYEIYGFLKLDISKIENLTTIQTRIQYHILTIKKEYLTRLRKEFDNINFEDTKFDTATDYISNLLEILVAQGLHSGHSIGFIAASCEGLVEDQLNILINQLFKIFSFEENRLYQCFTLAKSEQILNLLHSDLSTEDKGKFKSREVPVSFEGYKFQVSGKDAYSALRNTVVKAFRQLALKQPGIDQNDLKQFWEQSYYFNDGSKIYSKYKFNNFIDDPMISSVRKNTLYKSLEPYNKLLGEFSDEILENFEESLYFYHLAHSVPSVENSYLLLWTSLESIMGLRVNDSSDIAIVKDNVSRTLALGALGRRVNSIVQRLRKNGSEYGWKYYKPRVHDGSNNRVDEFQEVGLCYWLAWLADHCEKTESDPFDEIEEEPLLCRQYTTINNHKSNRSWKSLKQIRQVITLSEKNTRYQLDRLYLTRNRIVHAGKFGRTGIYLWGHLEWYIGKIIAVSLLLLDSFPKELYENKDARDVIFSYIRGQYEATSEYLIRHQSESATFENISASGAMKFPVLCFESLPPSNTSISN